MELSLNLDVDLAKELSDCLEANDLVWDSLPLTIKMEYLAPFTARQIERERDGLVEAVRAA